MTEELAVFEAYSLIYEHHYASGFMVARDAFTESIGNTVPVVDEKDRDTIIGKAILSSDDKVCVLDENIVDMDCGGIQCEDCICNVDNLMMLANSQKLQLL